MKSAISKLAQAFLGCAAFCLLAAILIPWRGSARDLVQGRPPVSHPVSEVRTRPFPEQAPAAAISALFARQAITKPAVPAKLPATAPETRKPIEAPWLNYVGFFSKSAGTSSYILKDNRSGRVIVVSQGDLSQGWSLIEAADSRLIVRNGDDYFIVRKR